MGEVKARFFVLDILLLIVFLGLANMIFDLGGRFFILEFIFLLIVVFFAIISIAGAMNNARWSYIFLHYILALIIIDILFIYSMAGKPAFFITTTVAALLALLISVASIKKEEDMEENMEMAEDADEVTKEFSPGKYVASKTASTYHAPKCDWAKRIKKSNQVWLEDEKEAKAKGYKKHDCI